MKDDVRNGDVEFWLTNSAPGWDQDDQMHAWPTFRFDRILVNAYKSPRPPELHFTIFSEPGFRLQISTPCPELIASPYVLRGVFVRLAWNDSEAFAYLNGRPAKLLREEGRQP